LPHTAHSVTLREGLIGVAVTVVVEEVTQLSARCESGTGSLKSLARTQDAPCAGDLLPALNHGVACADLAEHGDVVGEAVAVIIDQVAQLRCGLLSITLTPTALS
jgi:hypothetical protein